MAKPNEIKYLTAIRTEKRPKKYCRFKKMGIPVHIDYKMVIFEEVPNEQVSCCRSPLSQVIP